MDRRTFLAATAGIVAAPLVAEAQQAGKVAHIGGSGDPIAEGLVVSLARPGGNVTGVANIAGLDIVGKRLELLKQVVPGVTRMAMLWNPTNPSHAPALKEVPGIAQSLRVEVRAIAA